jgi:hypothetical protein
VVSQHVVVGAVMNPDRSSGRRPPEWSARRSRISGAVPLLRRCDRAALHGERDQHRAAFRDCQSHALREGRDR